MDFDIYCDESRQDIFTTKDKKDYFLLIGGIWIPTSIRREVNKRIYSLKKKYDIFSELKWQKISKGTFELYISLIDLFLSFGDEMRFRCIVVDPKVVDFKGYHDDDKELGFYKFYYQLLHHWILDNNRYLIFCDQKSNKHPQRLKTLKDCLQKSVLPPFSQAVFKRVL